MPPERQPASACSLACGGVLVAVLLLPLTMAVVGVPWTAITCRCPSLSPPVVAHAPRDTGAWGADAATVLRQLEPLLTEAATTYGNVEAGSRRAVWASQLTRILSAAVPHDSAQPAVLPLAQPPRVHEVVLRFARGDDVVIADGILAPDPVIAATWGASGPPAECEAAVWGTAEGRTHCAREGLKCEMTRDKKAVVASKVNSVGGIPAGALAADVGSLGPVSCSPKRAAQLELTLRLRVPVPRCSATCGPQTSAAVPDLTTNPPGCRCSCKAGYGGLRCRACANAQQMYPHCAAEPYLVHGAFRPENPTTAECPQGLVEHRCNMTNYPLALRAGQAEVGPQYMGPIACSLSAMPWRCEAMAQGRKVPVASLCTLITGEFVGAHFALLFESVRIFAPHLPFVVGIDRYSSRTQMELDGALSGRGVKIEFERLGKTPGLPFWFHEKPALMLRVLQRHANTLWLDADCFLVAPPPPMPDPGPGLFTFGVSIHDYRAWGAKHIPTLYGFTNTGVVWAAQGSRFLQAWIDVMRRAELNNAKLKLTPPHYLDQGPLDLALGAIKGAFRLEPHWNVAWWTPDEVVDKAGRPNWWASPPERRQRLALSDDGAELVLDGSPVLVVHSHFVAEEKQYGTLDRPFNTRIFELLGSARAGSPLRRFYDAALSRFATHVKTPASNVVRVQKASTDFLRHMQQN
eukprot:TRINITY_DN30387_c0_g1_i1.p1 TRINITY_DN30387_c0_g1~~TRINITY_DN30387_c0_g1_i1.p1  ORF type:complete len:708 (+),score=130.96 TRINITY_DN30387_c0_g1_i1:55-2124(+)